MGFQTGCSWQESWLTGNFQQIGCKNSRIINFLQFLHHNTFSPYISSARTFPVSVSVILCVWCPAPHHTRHQRNTGNKVAWSWLGLVGVGTAGVTMLTVIWQGWSPLVRKWWWHLAGISWEHLRLCWHHRAQHHRAQLSWKLCNTAFSFHQVKVFLWTILQKSKLSECQHNLIVNSSKSISTFLRLDSIEKFLR